VESSDCQTWLCECKYRRGVESIRSPGIYSDHAMTLPSQVTGSSGPLTPELKSGLRFGDGAGNGTAPTRASLFVHCGGHQERGEHQQVIVGLSARTTKRSHSPSPFANWYVRNAFVSVTPPPHVAAFVDDPFFGAVNRADLRSSELQQRTVASPSSRTPGILVT
jgi:hypothetical protein